MKNIILLINVMVLSFSIIFAQEQKPPILENDNAEITVCDTLHFNVTLNDWWMEGHSVQIVTAGAQNGEVVFNDSIISYFPNYTFGGIDSISYKLQDNENGLISDPGYLVVFVINNSNDNLNTNNVNATFMAYGLHYWGGEDIMGFEVPKGGNKHTIFSHSFWIAGLDDNNELHLAAESYRQGGEDYQSGPVSNVYDSENCSQWNRIWKLDLEQIQYHRDHWWESGYIPIEPIESWPAIGDVSNGQAADLAPYNDVNNNSVYDPENGDFPAIRGSQALFFIFNDDMNHSETNGEKLEIEIHGMAYSFNCPHDSAFNNAVFLNYDVINRSDNNYHDTYVGNYTDFDIGNAWDDFVGCDTLLHSFYGYNGDSIDNQEKGNLENFYGDNPPAQALSFLNFEMNSLFSFNNSYNSSPYLPEEYYLVLQGFQKDSSYINPNNPGISYSYPGDPTIPGDDNEATANNAPGDRRGISASGPYNFEQGDTLSFEVAFIFGRNYNGDNISSVVNMKERIEHIRFFYESDTTPCGRAWSGIREIISSGDLFSLYPNPATNVLIVSAKTKKDISYEVFDIMGRKITNGKLKDNYNSIDISKLEKGIYLMKLEVGMKTQIQKFIKE